MKRGLSFMAGVFVVAGALPAASYTINVSPNGSDNSGDGSVEKPLACLAAAMDKVRELKKSDAAGRFEIVFDDGVYFFKSSGDCVKIDEKLSGRRESPFVVRAKNPGKVLFVGGVRLGAGDFERVSDEAVLSKLPGKVEGVLYRADLKKFGVKSCGKWEQYGFSSGNFRATPTEVFSPDFDMVCARYPNSGMMNWEKTLVSSEPPKDGKSSKEKREFGKIKYSDSRHARWTGAKYLMLSGVFRHSWAYDVLKAGRIDPAAKTMELGELLSYGLAPETNKNFKSFNKYFVFNLLEEIDAIGEYYVDADSLELYAMLPNDIPESAAFYVSICPQSPLAFESGSFFQVGGIDFYAFRADALAFKNCRFSSVSDCRFKYLGKKAVSFSAKTFSAADGANAKMLSHDNSISGCSAEDTGTGGFSMQAGERVNLLNGKSQIFNCRVSRNSRLGGSYCPGIAISGVGVAVRHCLIENQAHEGVAWSGNDCAIEFNRFERCCYMFDDMGAIYTGRNPSNAGNVVRYNFFSEITSNNPDSMMAGVYVDDGSGRYLIEKNIFCRVGNPGWCNRFGTIFFHGGDNNIVSRNIFVDCTTAVATSVWSDEHWEKYWAGRYNFRLKKDVDIHSPRWLEKYPFMKDILAGDRPRLNMIWGNLLYNSNLTMRGVYKIAGNEYIKPDVPIGEVKRWTPSEFEKYFGKNPLAAEILSKKPGLLK